jgi:tRNA threonylcarbamoyladenosine biosynthesis protein TsaE
MSSPRLELRAPSLHATHALAAALASLSRPGDVILLAGDMGTGKTAFAQGFGRALGVAEPITSPTFTLVHSYETPGATLHHADLYRLDHLAEVADLALAELAEFDGIVLVEWGDVVESTFGDHLVVRLAHVDEDVDARVVTIQPIGRTWAARWALLMTVCARAVDEGTEPAGDVGGDDSADDGGAARGGR